MALPVLQYLYNLTILSQCLQIICPYLQDPTLIYHDGSSDVDVIAKSISELHTVVIAEVPEQPENSELYSTRSAILLAKSPEPVTSIIRIWSMWKARSRVVVFLYESSGIQGWIEALWKKTRAADILVVVLSEPPQYFTWFPYKARECSNVTTIVTVNRSNLFPKKFSLPLNNCPFVGVTTPLPPFVVDEMHGSESRMFRDLAEKLGMKPTYWKLPEGQNVWTVFDSDYQPNNGLKLLYENQVDVVFSEMATSFIVVPYSEFLMPHYTENYVLIVPGPMEAPRTRAILKAFSPLAWTFVIISSILIYAAMVAIPFLETGHIQPAFIPSIAIILNLPGNFPPSRAVLTFVVVAYIYSMHITTAYTSSLIIFLSDVPRQKSLESLRDVVDSGLPVQVHIGFQSTIDILSSFSPLINAINKPDRILYVTKANASMVAAGLHCGINPKMSYATKLRKEKFYDEFDYPRVKMLNEVIFFTFVAFYISKGHPLYEELNTNFIRLIEGGFPGHYTYLVEEPKRPRLRNLQPFGIQNVEGPFTLLLGLLGACTLAWICEWIYFWLRKLFKQKGNWGKCS